MLVIDLALRLFAYQMDEDSLSEKSDLRILIQSHEFDCTLFYLQSHPRELLYILPFFLAFTARHQSPQYL